MLRSIHIIYDAEYIQCSKQGIYSLLVNLLSSVLDELRMRSTLYCKCELRGAWGFDFRYEKGAIFYMLTQGQCWLEVEGEKGVWLRTGDFVVLPKSHRHTVRNEPGSPTIPLEDLMEHSFDATQGKLRYGNGEQITQMLGGCLWFSEPHTNLLLQSLPPSIRISAESGLQNEYLRKIFELLTIESNSAEPCSEHVVARISDILFIQAIRSYMAELPSQPGNWLCALRERDVGRAMTMMHSQLRHSWTVEELATQLSVSRSALAERFKRMVGVSPIQYLIEQRMHRAKQLLRQTELSIDEVAFEIGYESGIVLSKVFKQRVGIPPSQYRKQSLARDN